MKTVIISILCIMSSGVVAQNISFSSYNNISDADFREFVKLFDAKNLPISTDEVIQAMNTWQPDKKELTNEEINRYLIDLNELIAGPLYYQEQEDGLPDVPIAGKFYPLYKLPTSGNYVLLVFAQVDKIKECAGRVFAASYNLEGNFLYLSNYTYRAGSENINSYIDEALQSHMIYIVNMVNGELTMPPTDQPFTGESGHLIYQINADGKSTKVGFTKTSGQFEYSLEECRFKEVN